VNSVIVVRDARSAAEKKKKREIEFTVNKRRDLHKIMDLM
jgi:hypothetical protein